SPTNRDLALTTRVPTATPGASAGHRSELNSLTGTTPSRIRRAIGSGTRSATHRRRIWRQISPVAFAHDPCRAVGHSPQAHLAPVTTRGGARPAPDTAPRWARPPDTTVGGTWVQIGGAHRAGWWLRRRTGRTTARTALDGGCAGGPAGPPRAPTRVVRGPAS